MYKSLEKSASIRQTKSANKIRRCVLVSIITRESKGLNNIHSTINKDKSIGRAVMCRHCFYLCTLLAIN